MQDAADLTPQQIKVLSLLLGGSTIEAAAAGAGVNPATVHRWLAQPGFADAYRAGRTRALGQAVASLQTGAVAVVAELRLIAVDRTVAASTRVAAARAFLDLALRGTEIADLADRVLALESAAADRAALGEAEHESDE